MEGIQDKANFAQYFEELRKSINEKNLNPHSHIYGCINLLTSISVYAIGIIFMSEIPLFAIIFIFYILIVELGFISHDLIHNQYFKNPKINEFFSYISGNLLIGLSRSWWVKKHNMGHHAFTNSDIHDMDIRDYDDIFTRNQGRFPFFKRHRIYLFWIATSLLYFNLIFLSYKHIFENKNYGELILNITNILILPGSLLYHFGYSIGFLSLILIYTFAGVHLAFVFMTNHIGMEVIDGVKIKDYTWLDLQTRTSRNISGGSIIHHIFGGLNKQIEHHLFPHISRKNIIKVAKLTGAFCSERGIPYHEVDFVQALREIQHTLKTGETI